MLTLFRPKLTLSSPYVGPMVAYVAMQVRTPIAVTETTEVTETAGVGTGWGGGGNGVGTAGATALITFGYQPKASGKGTDFGLWLAPGFKG